MRAVNVENAAYRSRDSAIKVAVAEFRFHSLANCRGRTAAEPPGLDAGAVRNDVIFAIALVDENQYAVDLILCKSAFSRIAYVGQRSALCGRNRDDDDFFLRLRVEVTDARIELLDSVGAEHAGIVLHEIARKGRLRGRRDEREERCCGAQSFHAEINLLPAHHTAVAARCFLPPCGKGDNAPDDAERKDHEEDPHEQAQPGLPAASPVGYGLAPAHELCA